ncbi:unnamed protein product [Allacma fusca]|uniref:Tumor susceptibility gene 101 protein n=1 Tax=Allacma fusca TaxID=39272 RepID=A0A8J2P1G0_9HEXA|nr:unnamed protein product [Allacma fusca]
MSEHDSFIRQSLASAKYRNEEKTRRDAIETLQHYRGLKPGTDVFVFNDGSEKMLLNLTGTIPVNYKGATYNIPIVLWLLDTHPLNAPMVFVRPTPDMRIKVSRHVDQTGKVYLPYLHDWSHTTSDLATLIQVLILTFGEQSPVYSVYGSMPVPNVQSSYPPQSYSTPYPAIPNMPMPASGMSVNNHIPPFNLRQSLATAAEEKLRRRLEEIFLSREIYRKSGAELAAGQSKLNGLLTQLETEKVNLQQHLNTLENEERELDTKISKQQAEENELVIDDAVNAPTPLHKQILNAYSEEAALEDTIYYLGEAFRREKLDLEQYLKHIKDINFIIPIVVQEIEKCEENLNSLSHKAKNVVEHVVNTLPLYIADEMPFTDLSSLMTSYYYLIFNQGGSSERQSPASNPIGYIIITSPGKTGQDNAGEDVTDTKTSRTDV